MLCKKLYNIRTAKKVYAPYFIDQNIYAEFLPKDDFYKTTNSSKHDQIDLEGIRLFLNFQQCTFTTKNTIGNCIKKSAAVVHDALYSVGIPKYVAKFWRFFTELQKQTVKINRN